ncbi:endonuclease III domain-containing protein [Holophaga foetida]|uniref:endonuclease III domain-containing protein n=1 Tax=Holophaga foetida TaxID=35839 RepID=UPI0002472F22|nr:endonuclease III [Holophaga foetida]
MRESPLFQLYRRLLAEYGPQGWWPLLDHPGTNPTKTGSITGYHPGDYAFPKTDAQRFEIGVGAILTQNTAWPNVEKALVNMKAASALDPQSLLDLAPEALGAMIRPSGYFNAKTRKLKAWASFYLGLVGAVPSRPALLEVWGIGPETADSIRLYAYEQPELVVDAYTRRVLETEGLVPQGTNYEALKKICIDHLPADPLIYQEFHALMVERAKRMKTHPLGK